MKQIISLALAITCIVPRSTAQYAPQAGSTGSTAIHKNSTEIINWASQCSIRRGWMDISDPGFGLAASGDSTLATGAADNYVVSLGDSGVAVLTFPHPISNGPGADFAIFENGFIDPADAEQAFIELAFVEVSSDGINFFRFPASSLTQANSQIAGAGVYMNARNVHNLAGKYVSSYGTPFDLDELANMPGLNVNSITHVRLVDVIGSIDKYASRDAANNIINDPYPTPYPIGGFDLDAVGVLHQNVTSTVVQATPVRVQCYPNPAKDYLRVETASPVRLRICDLTGKQVAKQNVVEKTVIDLRNIQAGVYFIQFITTEGNQWTERFIKL